MIFFKVHAASSHFQNRIRPYVFPNISANLATFYGVDSKRWKLIEFGSINIAVQTIMTVFCTKIILYQKIKCYRKINFVGSHYNDFSRHIAASYD